MAGKIAANPKFWVGDPFISDQDLDEMDESQMAQRHLITDLVNFLKRIQQYFQQRREKIAAETKNSRDDSWASLL